MKRGWTTQLAVLLATVFLTAAALHAGPAAAEPWRAWRMSQGQQDRDRGQQRQRDAGQPDRYQRQDRQQQQRLSDDERRDLHRDLDKARREIYKPRDR
jgi:Spy/CpxP family protein refolding chaperone